MESLFLPFFVETPMRASKACIDLIKSFEGCKLHAYQDSAGHWTIGWGTTGQGIVEGLTISQPTANGMLLDHIGSVSEQVSDVVKFRCSQAQFDALVCFTYNVGIGNLKSSTLLKDILKGDMKAAAEEFLKWDKAGGKQLAGLTRRRQAEKSLFES